MSQKFIIIILITIVIGLITLLSGAAFNATVQSESIEAEKHVQSACEAAVDKMDMDSEVVLGSNGVRTQIRQAFWRAYCKSSGYVAVETGKTNGTGIIASDKFGLNVDSRAKYDIPCVLYVDRNGYYMEYTRYTKSTETEQFEYESIYTNKQSFSKDYGSGTTYHVTYTLGQDVTVVRQDQNGPKKVYGDYTYCYKEMGNPEVLDFMADGKSFMEEHDICIQDAISGAINYSINANNTKNRQNKKYVFAMPNSNSSFGRMIKNPCVIAFMQGKQVAGRNIYAFAGASIERCRMYYMYVYDMNGTTAKCYTDNEDTEKIKVGTMRELAKDGALPDLD